MNRKDFWYRLLVTDAHLDSAFDGAELADQRIVLDLSVGSIVSGLAVAQAGSPNLTVQVSAGVAYDQLGQRTAVPSTQTVDVSVDHLDASTAVTGPGNQKWLSVYAVFERAESDPFVDGNSVPGFFTQDESYSLKVYQGAEAPVPTRPSLVSPGLLLADILIDDTTTQVLDDAIDVARRQDSIVVAGVQNSIRRGFLKDAIADVAGWLDNHLTSSSSSHNASSINYLGGDAWGDGTPNPATTVEDQLDKIITDLNNAVTSSSGIRKIGAEVLGATNTIPIGTLFDTLTALKTAAKIDYAGGGGWLDGTTNPAASVEAQLDKFVSDLVGQGSTTSGGHKLGLAARTAWLGGRTNVATTVFAGIDKIITDLAATTTGDDGAKRIGAQAVAGVTYYSLASGSVRSQLDELLSFVNASGQLTQTNAWTGANTFDDLTLSGTNKVKLASRSITRVQPWNVVDGSTGAVINHNSSSNLASGATIRHYLNVPNGVTLTGVTVYIDPPNDGVLPGTSRPTVQLVRYDVTTGSSTTISATVEDPNATTGAYEAHHGFGLTGESDVIDRTTSIYYVNITGETGANATAVYYAGCSVTYTATAMDDGY